jgi:hypothetical protein
MSSFDVADVDRAAADGADTGVDSVGTVPELDTLFARCDAATIGFVDMGFGHKCSGKMVAESEETVEVEHLVEG